jgi:HEPN pEK499 p136
MAYYANEHFIKEFASRTLANFQSIQHLQAHDTALISFLLAVFGLPRERAGDQDKYTADLLSKYGESFSKVVQILRERPDKPTTREDLPRYLRNAVAHFNIRPETDDGQTFTHLVIWNRIPETARNMEGRSTS